VTRKHRTRRKPERTWRIEPVPRAEPDLNRLATILATLAMDRARTNKPAKRLPSAVEVGIPS
jgi:hypothetical protein